MRTIIPAFVMCVMLASCGLSWAADPGTLVVLEGDHDLQLCSLALTDENTTLIYPRTSHPVYLENQSITGFFLASPEEGPDQWKAVLAPFNASALVRGMTGQQDPLDSYPLATANCSLNSSGYATFVLPGQRAGIYNVYVLDDQTTLLAASLAVVVEDILNIDGPESIAAGQDLTLNLSLDHRLSPSVIPPDRDTRIWGAVVVSEEDFRNASAEIITNQSGYDLNISISNRWHRLENVQPAISILANLLMIMPRDSTAGIQESNNTDESLNLLTDPGWKEGNYLITCAAIYKNGTPAGVGQRNLQVN